MKTNAKRIASYLGKTAQLSIDNPALDVPADDRGFRSIPGKTIDWPMYSGKDSGRDFLRQLGEDPQFTGAMQTMHDHPFKTLFNKEMREGALSDVADAGANAMPLPEQYAAAGGVGGAGLGAIIATLLSKDHKLRNAVIGALAGGAGGALLGAGAGQLGQEDIEAGMRAERARA